MNRTLLALTAALMTTACTTRGGAMTGFESSERPQPDMTVDPADADPLDMPVGQRPQDETDAAAIAPTAPTCPGGDAPEGPTAEVWQALVDGCSTWQAHDQDVYVYIIERSFFGPPEQLAPVAVEVVDGVAVRATHMESRAELNPAAYGTMEDIFFELAEIASQEPHAFGVEFGDPSGIPTAASVDWHEAAMDDWMDLRVELVRPQPLQPVD